MQVKCSPVGGDYDRCSFLRTPVKEIMYVLQFCFEDEKRRANIFSVSTAKLAQIVLQTAHAFGGSKEPVKAKITDFLPFELDSEASEREDLTKQILTKLIKSRRIPAHVIAALSSHITPG